MIVNQIGVLLFKIFQFFQKSLSYWFSSSNWTKQNYVVVKVVKER